MDLRGVKLNLNRQDMVATQILGMRAKVALKMTLRFLTCSDGSVFKQDRGNLLWEEEFGRK